MRRIKKLLLLLVLSAWCGLYFALCANDPVVRFATGYATPYSIYPTVVTAYYNIPSKASNATYYQWMRNFLPRIPCQLYVFTDATYYKRVKFLRKSQENRTKILILPLEKLKMFEIMHEFRKQKELDQEQYHTPELYAIWNEKASFVQRAILDNPFNSEVFIWCDIGSFRDKHAVSALRRFPNPAKTLLLERARMHFLSTHVIRDGILVSLTPRPSEEHWWTKIHIGGGIFGGDIAAWQAWYKVYYEQLLLRLAHGEFIGKDQVNMVDAVLQYPDLVTLIRPYFYSLSNNTVGSPWFYLQYFWS